MKKWHKYIKRFKEALWKRRKHEHLIALREKHNQKHEDKTFKINIGDVVMIKGGEKNWAHWKTGIVNHCILAKTASFELLNYALESAVNRQIMIKQKMNRTSRQECSVKKVFLEILQNSQENTGARVSFLIKLQASASAWNFHISYIIYI